MRFWRNLPMVLRGRSRSQVGLGVAALMVLVVVALLVSSALGIFAASPSPAQAHHLRGNSDKVRVHGTRPRALTGLKAVGKADGSQVLQFSVALRLPHATALSSLIAQQQTPGSAKYHQYLTPQSFTDQYAPSASDVAAVRAFLQQHGLKVKAIASNRLFVNAEGTVAQVEQAFGVSIGQYQVGKRQVYAPDQDPIIPDTLARIVVGVNGLDNVGIAHPHFVKGDKNSKRTAGSAPSPQVLNPSPSGGFTPANLRSAYDVSTLITNGGTGASQRVAVFELTPYVPGDIAAYRAQYGLPTAAINSHSVDAGVVTCTTAGSLSSTCDDFNIAEADLDIEVVSAIAPNATQDVYTGPNTWQGINDTYSAIVQDNAAKVVTTSWGLCEPNIGTSEMQTLDDIFAQAASQGQTIFAAAGDSGSDDCFDRYNNAPSGLPPSVDSPASDPYVMGVGGTSLTLSSGAYSSEQEWNNAYGAGGGGASSYFSKPSWQVGAGVVNSYAAGQREVPDVGANADPATGYSFYCTSQLSCFNVGWDFIGGTSAAAPLWAGITADINTYLIGHSSAALGWANQTFYTLFASAQTNIAYRDVLIRNNDIDYNGTSYAGSYPSATCYDMNTGVGTPLAWNMAQDVKAGPQSGGVPCPAGAPGTELIQDNSFENATSSWQQFSSDGYTTIDAPYPHSGNNSTFLCAYPGCDDRVWQDVTVPATVNSATLTFFEEAYTDLTSLSASPEVGVDRACLDHFYVTLTTPDGTIVSNIPGSCATNSYGYTFHAFNVTSVLQAHQGQQLRIMFRGTTSNISVLPVNSSAWFVDDVSLVVS